MALERTFEEEHHVTTQVGSRGRRHRHPHTDLAVDDHRAPAAAAPVHSSVQAARVRAAMHEAVVQDNVSYNARDEEAYMEVIHPDIIFHVAGTTTYGIDAHMESVRAAWANPEPWEWQWEILSETMFGCHTGIAVARHPHRLPEPHPPVLGDDDDGQGAGPVAGGDGHRRLRR